jgi:glycosyltransferase involved in cell wall biosynthesis
VVPNGIDLSRFHPDIKGTRMRREYGIGFDEPLALQLGRVYEQKRPQDFVQAFVLARRQVPKLRGLLIGWDDSRRPPGKADIRRLYEKEGLGDSLVIAEGRPEAPELMAAADILVSPGLEEAGGPLVVAEAMAAGKPVIGARSGGTVETIVDGETGFLVPPKTPTALAEKLALLASNQELRHQMGVAGRRRAEREFDGRLMAARFARIYEELVDARRPGR